MNRIATLLVIVAALSVAAGCASTPPAAAADPADEARDFWSHRFGLVQDLEYGDDPNQKLDLYLQGAHLGEPQWFERAPEPRPTLLFIHGGGWVSGDKAGQEPKLLPFVERGWHVVNINYRQGPGTAPAAVDDVLAALGWLVENADVYGFDTDRVVVSGGSAGGHLALVTGILGSRAGHPASPGSGFEVEAVVNWYGITDIAAVEAFLAAERPDGNYARAWAGDVAAIPELSERYSPLHLAGPDSPPVLTIHGVEDTVVPHDQALALHARLGELGVVHELRSMAGANHGGFSEAQFQESFEAIFAFLEGLQPAR